MHLSRTTILTATRRLLGSRTCHQPTGSHAASSSSSTNAPTTETTAKPQKVEDEADWFKKLMSPSKFEFGKTSSSTSFPTSFSSSSPSSPSSLQGEGESAITKKKFSMLTPEEKRLFVFEFWSATKDVNADYPRTLSDKEIEQLAKCETFSHYRKSLK